MDSLLILATAISFVFGWNNSSILIGNLRSAGSISYRSSFLLTSTGLVLGFLLEGAKMNSSLISLGSTATPSILEVTLAVSLLAVIVFSIIGLPISFSIVIVGSFLGSTIAKGNLVKFQQFYELVIFWILAPFLSALISFIIYNTIKRIVSHLGLVEVDLLNRIGIIVAGLSASYSLGANNIGLFEGATYKGPYVIIILLISAITGTFLLGGGNVSGSIGDRLMNLSPQGVLSTFIASSITVWVGTQLAFPISISQCLLGGMFGAAYTRKVAAINKNLVYETALLWIVAPALCFAIAYILSSL
jgi:phosphate/sulfate permease